MSKIAIGGGCRCGKTTLAANYSGIVRHTDDLRESVKYPNAADAVCRWFDEPFDVIEGVLVLRGLRRWLDLHPQGKPCDQLLLLFGPYEPLTNQQRNFNRGLRTILHGIRAGLLMRGVEVRELHRE